MKSKHTIQTVTLEELSQYSKEEAKEILKEVIYNYRLEKGEIEKTFECEICYDEVDMKDTYSCRNGHKYCKGCWRDHIDGEISGNELVKCIENECNELIPFNDIFNIILEKAEDFEKFEKYIDRLSRKKFENNISICPNCNVETYMTNPKQFVECIKCKHKYCKECLKKWHEDQTCEEYEAFLKKKSEIDAEDEKWRRENTRVCPKCKKLIYRESGCNRMTCQCGHWFCWLCYADLDVIKYNHFEPDHPTNKQKCQTWNYPPGYVHPPLPK